MQMPEHLLKIQSEELLLFVDNELMGMVGVVDFDNNTVFYRKYDDVSQRLIDKTKTGKIVFAVNKNRAST